MIYVITGTDTDVGKTVATATYAAQELAAGRSVAVYKPTQTGVSAEEPADAQNVANWLGRPRRLGLAEGVRLREAMAPLDAALVAGGQTAVDELPTLEDHLARIENLATNYDTVLVEGAGGLLVKLTVRGETIAELAAALQAQLVVVTRADLGTLNHTELTLEAARNRGFEIGTLLVGSFPAEPIALHLRNRENLEELTGQFGWTFAGQLPAGLAGPQCAARLKHAAQKISALNSMSRV